MKQRKSDLEEEIKKLEGEVKHARSEVGSVTKELQSANKAKIQLEAAIENEQAHRHTLLMQCKMDDIPIPFNNGSLDELGEFLI